VEEDHVSLFGGASSVGCAGESPTIPAEVVRATVMSKHGFYVFAVAASGLLMASGRYVSGALVVENWFSVGVGMKHHLRKKAPVFLLSFTNMHLVLLEVHHHSEGVEDVVAR